MPRTPSNSKTTKRRSRSAKNKSASLSSSLNKSKKPKRNVTKVIINNREVYFTKSLASTIVKLQKMVREMVPKLPFSRIVREVTQNHGEFRYTPEALTALQMSTELYMTQLFECSNKCAYHAKRVTLFPKDMNLVLDLRGSADPAHDYITNHR